MRKAVALLVVTPALAFVAANVTTTSAYARSCGTVSAPGFHAFDVTTKRLTCKSARRTLRTWLLNDAKPSSGPPGWRCRSAFARPWRCTRRHAVMKFIFHSY